MRLFLVEKEGFVSLPVYTISVDCQNGKYPNQNILIVDIWQIYNC